jgi:hypothetical protein
VSLTAVGVSLTAVDVCPLSQIQPHRSLFWNMSSLQVNKQSVVMMSVCPLPVVIVRAMLCWTKIHTLDPFAAFIKVAIYT